MRHSKRKWYYSAVNGISCGVVEWELSSKDGVKVIQKDEGVKVKYNKVEFIYLPDGQR